MRSQDKYRHEDPYNLTEGLNPLVKKAIVLIFTMVFSLSAFHSSYANPQGGQVVSGNATVSSPNSNTVLINQSSDKVILNWNSFNIGNGETTQFVQPSAQAAALNRISPTQGASQIYGNLTANGQIILVNPAGIHFGPTAMVNVGGIIASTSDISNGNF